MSEVSVQMLDIWMPVLGRKYHLQVLSGTIRVMIAAIQDAIFEDERIPLTEEYACLFGLISQTTLWGFHSLT